MSAEVPTQRRPADDRPVLADLVTTAVHQYMASYDLGCGGILQMPEDPDDTLTVAVDCPATALLNAWRSDPLAYMYGDEFGVLKLVRVLAGYTTVFRLEVGR